jgi:hypothetical protein
MSHAGDGSAIPVAALTGRLTYFLGAHGSSNPHIRHLQRELDQWDDLTPHQKHQLASILEAVAKHEGEHHAT